jgi:hypothetical protein
MGSPLELTELSTNQPIDDLGLSAGPVETN